MRKMVFGRQLSRGRKAREALIRSLISDFVVNGKMTTTKAKIKFVQAQIDKIATLVRKNTISSRRKVLAFLGNHRKIADLLFGKIKPFWGERTSGFSRIILLPSRVGDNAQMARLEWTDKVEMITKEDKKAKKQKKEKGKEPKAIKEAKKETKKVKK